MKKNIKDFRHNLIAFRHPSSTDVQALRNLWKEAFNDNDDFLNLFFKTAYSPNRCLCAAIDGNVVAALYWFNCELMGEPIAYIYAVATSIKYRSKGICHELIKETHNLLKSAGYAGSIIAPQTESLFKFYETFGYKISCCIDSFSVDVAIDNTSVNVDKHCLKVRKIDKKEYALLRRRFLPSNGVLQENENLNFLEAQVNFYTGNDFLLAAYEDSDILNGLEFLGNKDITPVIIDALGFKKGYFRSPFGDKPFAMYTSLRNTPPKFNEDDFYFGFIFD